MNSDIDSLIRRYQVWSTTAKSVSRDIESVESGNIVGYNVDYSVLFPYVWGLQNFHGDISNQGEWDGVCRSLCQQMLRYSLPAGTKFIFTSASFMEAIDNIQQNISTQTSTRDSIDLVFPRINQELEDVESSLGKIISDDLMTRRQLEDRLNRIARKIGHSPTSAISKLRTFIAAGGPLVGLKDLVSNLNLSNYSQRYRELYEEMEKTRGKSPRETRPIDVRRMHYKIDCANIVICEAISDAGPHTELGFVTKASNKKHLVGYHGRTSLMVLLLLRSHRLTEFPDNSSRMNYIQWMEQAAERIITQLRSRSSIDEVRDRYLLKDIKDFDEKYITPIFGKSTFSNSDLEEKLAAVKKATADKKFLAEKIDSSITSTRSELKSIIDEHYNVFDDELLTTFEIDEEPRAKVLLQR
jgi:hypothetical protein